jgi:hypothetical protein
MACERTKHCDIFVCMAILSHSEAVLRKRIYSPCNICLCITSLTAVPRFRSAKPLPLWLNPNSLPGRVYGLVLDMPSSFKSAHRFRVTMLVLRELAGCLHSGVFSFVSFCLQRSSREAFACNRQTCLHVNVSVPQECTRLQPRSAGSRRLCFGPR